MAERVATDLSAYHFEFLEILSSSARPYPHRTPNVRRLWVALGRHPWNHPCAGPGLRGARLHSTSCTLLPLLWGHYVILISRNVSLS